MTDLLGTVVAVDPGPHTGLAWFLDGRLVETQMIDRTAPNMSDAALFVAVAKFIRRAGQGEPAASVTILVESYQAVSGLYKDGAFALQVIGWVRGLASVYGYIAVERLPAARTAFLGDATTYATRGASRHERDAVAHGLAWMNRPAKPVTKREPSNGK